MGTGEEAVEVSLMAKNKLGFVKGTTKKPESRLPQIAQWERCNNMVFFWLLHSLMNDTTESVVYCETASEIWNEVEQ